MPYRGAISDDHMIAWWMTGLRSDSVEEKEYPEHEQSIKVYLSEYQ
jgi:hypothetical protein